MDSHAGFDTGIIPHLSTGFFPLSEDLRLRDNAGMQNPRKIIAERVSARIAESGLSARTVSMHATGKPDVIRDMLRRGSAPSGATLAKIAEILGTTTDYLVGLSTSPDQPQSEVSFREVEPGWRGRPDDRIPLLGTGYCDDFEVDAEGHPVAIDRVQLELDHTIRLIERPAALWNAPDAYAIYYHGSSMEPRFYQGEVGIVDPRRPAGPGDFVVVQLNDGASDQIVTVLVKQLERVAGGYVHLRQFNPDLRFRLPRAQVARMHRIASPTELFGG